MAKEYGNNKGGWEPGGWQHHARGKVAMFIHATWLPRNGFNCSGWEPSALQHVFELCMFQGQEFVKRGGAAGLCHALCCVSFPGLQASVVR